MTTMASITHCLKRPTLDRWVELVVAIMLCFFGGVTQAQSTPQETPVLKIERMDDALWLSAQLRFELPSVVEDALLKGIPIFFVAQVDVSRERWYWTNKKISSFQRSMRLSYHPLTRRWRLNTATGEASESAQGLALNQNFDTLADAMTTVRRISRWKIAEASEVEPGIKHSVEFRFALDMSQLPRPLQIGTLGQSDWSVSVSAVQTLVSEPGK